MKTCEHCGAVLSDEVTLCATCGEVQEEYEGETYVPPVYDSAQEESGLFQFPEKEEEGKETGSRGRRSWILVVLIVVGAAVLLSVLVTVLLFAFAIFVLPGIGMAIVTAVAAAIGLPLVFAG